MFNGHKKGYNAIKIEQEQFDASLEDNVKEMEALEKDIFEAVGYEFEFYNVAIEKAIFESLGVVPDPKFVTKGGTRLVSKEATKHYASLKDEKGNLKYPTLKKIHRYRSLNQMVESFYGKSPKLENSIDIVNNITENIYSGMWLHSEAKYANLNHEIDSLKKELQKSYNSERGI